MYTDILCQLVECVLCCAMLFFLSPLLFCFPCVSCIVFCHSFLSSTLPFPFKEAVQML